MKSSETIRYFPFSPGIPWKIKRGKYIVPELTSDAWTKATKSRDVIVLAHGGLIESFVSLSLFEALNYASSPSKLMWAGNPQFESIVKMNGLGAICPVPIPPKTVQDYPVPVFLDKSSNTYFNCLNNYLDVKTFYGEIGFKDHRPIVQQIVTNFVIPWENRFIPRQRNNQLSKKDLESWAKISRFQFNRPYVCVFPDRGLSQHNLSTLGWNEAEVKALASMLRQKGISCLVFTNNAGKYYASHAHVLPAKPEYMVMMLEFAKAVLSEEVDQLIIAEMISSSKIIARPSKNEVNLYKNRRYLKSSNVIHTIRALTPVRAFEAICGEI